MMVLLCFLMTLLKYSFSEQTSVFGGPVVQRVSEIQWLRAWAVGTACLGFSPDFTTY